MSICRIPLRSPCTVERFTGQTGGPTHWPRQTSGLGAMSPSSRGPTHNLLTSRSTIHPDSRRVRNTDAHAPGLQSEILVQKSLRQLVCLFRAPLYIMTTNLAKRTNTELVLFHTHFSPAPNPCAAKDGKEPCSHLCLINYNQTFSCACPHLMKLGPDRRTCYGEHDN